MSWSERLLSPPGKITLSIILPKIIHLIISLHNPLLSCLKEIEHLSFKFIWNKKKTCKDGKEMHSTKI
jgi:hypothetical protein